MDAVEKWVHETFPPIVLTSSTPEVERLAQKNNLAFADLLNGFSMLKNADTPLRSVNHSYTVSNFNFRFISASQFAPLPLSDSMRLLNEVVTRHPPPPLGTGPGASNAVIDLDMPPVKSVDDVPVFLRVIGAANNSEPLSWYRDFKRALMDTFRCEEYSMLCQPAAMLLVVSSTESNPRHSFEMLSSPQSLPAVFSQGLYDANLPKFYLVLHDVAETDGTTIDPDAILRNLQIPSHSGAVLYFNSLALDAATDANVQLWSKHPYVRAALFPDANSGNYPYLTEHLGGFLSSEDLGRLDAFVREFGLRFVLPALEARIFQLNEIVSAMKKGVKNVFKSWLRKPKDLSSRTQLNSNSSVTYRADSIEAQTRLLADTAFMVRDYDLALQMYRLVRDDYKSDKSLYHCANANEMIALCLLLTKGSPVQMTNALDAASAAYYKITNPATCRLAVRAAVIAGEIYVTLSNSGLFTDYMDNASAALIRGSTMEQGICSAVLMERAAMCDLQARVPKFRKFGFRMVMAGHVYDSLGHSAHSARCYALARAVYDNSGWFQVEDHINFTLAQQSNRLNDPMSSINLFLKLIGTGRNSASQQEALLYEFGMIVKEFLASGATAGGGTSKNGPVAVRNSGSTSLTKHLVVHDLCMPELDDKSTVVFAPVNAIGINRDIDGNDTEGEAWKELERHLDKQILVHKQAMSMVPSGPSKDARGSNATSNRWLAPVQSFNLPLRGRRGAGQKKPRQYALGEKIYVEFEMKNALSCAVDVENIHLYGEFVPKGGDQEGFAIPVLDEDDTQVIVDRVNLQLLPVSEERVRLAVTPIIPGTLRITGVRWSICGGDVVGEHAFNIPGPLLQDTRANKEARARAPNTTLIADVVGEMPWLGVKVGSVRDVAENYIGELLQFNVELKNAGSSKLVNLQLCCTDLSVSVSSSESCDDLASYLGSSGKVVDLSHIILEPGEQRQVTLWARAHRAGKQQPRLLFKYKRHEEGEGLDRALSRCVKMKLELNVLPCVTIAYSVEPSFSNSGEYVLGVTATNAKSRRQNSDLIDVVMFETITCVSKSWRIVPFNVPSETQQHRDASRLDAQETSTFYFRMIPKEGDKFEDVVRLGEHSTRSLPFEQMLCLDFAHDVVRSAEALAGDASGGAGDRGPGGGIRSIQSVRRENKALKGNGEAPSAGDEQIPEPDPQPTTKDALLNAPDVDAHLIVAWSSPRASGDAAIGQTNLTNIKVRSQLKSSSCPLAIALDYDDTVLLQCPSGSPMAYGEVEVVMSIRNNSVLSASSIDFTLEMLHPEVAAVKTAHSSLLAPAPHFFWAGLTKKHVKSFAPGSKIEFKLRACFMRAGVYDLNRFRFLVSSSSGESPQSTPSEYVFPVEYLVCVHPAGVPDQGKLEMASACVGTAVQ